MSEQAAVRIKPWKELVLKQVAIGWRRTVSGIKRRPLGAAGILILLLMVIAAIFAGPLSPFDPNATSIKAQFGGMSRTHPFGADDLGRDTLSRVLFGARIALIVSFASVALGLAAGLIFGVVSGYLGKSFDLFSQRLVDMLIAVPNLILGLILVTVLGRSLFNVILAISITIFPGTVRLTRAMTISVKEENYVEAARALGASNSRVVFRHVMPQVIPLAIVLASSQLGFAILLEASLSFLGLGPPPPTPTWGSMMSGSILRYVDRIPEAVLFPLLFLSLTVLAINLVGDSLRDELDPRLRK